VFENRIDRSAYRLYDWGWRWATPLLRRHRRLADGFDQRMGRKAPPGPVDLWIQAASAGESFLAASIIETLHPTRPTDILLTANTRQGIDILDQAIEKAARTRLPMRIKSAFFPFDRPRIMQAAVACLRPAVMVLLETEIWPGLLAALKTHGCPALIINGRITGESLRRYRMRPSLWRAIGPERILAISNADAARYAELFGRQKVAQMPNIKFDRLTVSPGRPAEGTTSLRSLALPGAEWVVLGSVRREEEPAIELLIVELARRLPQAVIALIPRHLERLAAWQAILTYRGLPWVRRSAIDRPQPAGTIILWDTFGELAKAYCLAKAAFVGGSLAPLGGQNFLEPLEHGIRPVIGPFWENFAWVGQEILDQGLVRQRASWQAVAEVLVEDMLNPIDRETTRQQAQAFIGQRQGGTRQACALINRYLERRTESEKQTRRAAANAYR
jgi:3-deoxy-D-manno-octulosonic-acid transferase